MMLIKKTSHAHEQRYNFCIDPILSSQTQHEIISFIQHAALKNKTALIHLILATFPFINAVEMRHDATGLLAVSIESSQPWLSLNNDFIVTDCGNIVAKNCFESHVITNLNSIKLAAALQPNSKLSPLFMRSIAHISPDIFDAYTITWKSDEESWMQDKKDNNFFIMFNAQELPDQKKIDRCNFIKNELITNLSLSKKIKNKPLSYCADIRFKNQIICKSHVGGDWYG